MDTYLVLIGSVLASVILNTTGQILLKMGSGQSIFNWYLFSGLAAYGVSTVFYIIVLGKLNLSIVYPLVIGSTIIATTFAGTIVLRELVTPTHWVGIGLIISGIIAVTLGKVS